MNFFNDDKLLPDTIKGITAGVAPWVFYSPDWESLHFKLACVASCLSICYVAWKWITDYRKSKK